MPPPYDYQYHHSYKYGNCILENLELVCRYSDVSNFVFLDRQR